jgi:hypothetical protein
MACSARSRRAAVHARHHLHEHGNCLPSRRGGYNYNADFQALLWYPEKRLWLSGGVAPGRGSDSDYADAAIEAARQEGSLRMTESKKHSPIVDRVGIAAGQTCRTSCTPELIKELTVTECQCRKGSSEARTSGRREQCRSLWAGMECLEGFSGVN